MTDTPVFPRERYFCVPGDRSDRLMPPGRSAGESTAALRRNPRCWIAAPSEPPPGVEVPIGLFPDPVSGPDGWAIAWVDDPQRRTRWPHWIPPQPAELLRALAPGAAYAGGLPAGLVRALRTAAILTTVDDDARGRRAWTEAVATPLRGGCAPVRDVLPPLHLGALRRYYRYHAQLGTFERSDDVHGSRYRADDEPLARFVHGQLTGVVSALARRELAPSYSHLSIYFGGDALALHTDPEACDYTLTVCVDATPDPATHGAWPLHLDTGDGLRSVALDVGQGLLYRGQQLPHWRDRLPDGYTTTLLAFHFVDSHA